MNRGQNLHGQSDLVRDLAGTNGATVNITPTKGKFNLRYDGKEIPVYQDENENLVVSEEQYDEFGEQRFEELGIDDVEIVDDLEEYGVEVPDNTLEDDNEEDLQDFDDVLEGKGPFYKGRML